MMHDLNWQFRVRIVLRISFLLSAVVMLTAADATWKSKSISQWTLEDARQVLANSPWAKPTAIAILPRLTEDQLRDGGRMGGGTTHFWKRPDADSNVAAGGGEHASIEVRWESALPVRAAEVKAGETGAPAWDGDYYAIAVYDLPGITPAIQKNLRGALKQTTCLKRGGKKDLKPERVEISVSAGNLARIVYLFPRSAGLTTLDTRVEFVSQIGRIFVAQFFETGEMRLGGQLEL